jgi:UDP-glucuronate 4-epimerase
MSASKILLTGGAGFIGSSVTDALLERGDAVTVLDNFNDFYDPAIKRHNAAEIEAKGARLVEGDIRDGALVTKLFAEGAFDGVIHLAAMAGVRPSLLDPMLYEDVNMRGTLNILAELQKRPEIRFVFASSSSVYGGNESVPFREVDEIHHPCYTFHHLYGIPTTCLRFFTVYGPRQRPEMAIHKFVRAVHAGQSIPFFGDGTTRRDYTYIDDIVDGVVKSLDHCKGYEIYNLGESQTTSLAELVNLIGEVCGKEPVIARKPMQPGDVVVTFADIAKAKAQIGYAPKTLIREGLERFVAWYRAQNNI